MCFFKKTPKASPITDYKRLYRGDFITICQANGITPISQDTPLDTWVSVCSKSQLDTIAPSLVFPADLYIAEIADCEDYAIKAQSEACFTFHISGIRLALGNMPQGYHGFPLAIDKERNIWLFEPNAGYEYAGEWFKIGEHGYFPNKVFI